MSDTVVIQNIDGNSVEIDIDQFKAYQEEAFEYLKEEAEQKRSFKESVETIAETTGIDKKVLTKYFKQKFKEKTKEQSALGEIFAQLDEATEESLNIERD